MCIAKKLFNESRTKKEDLNFFKTLELAMMQSVMVWKSLLHGFGKQIRA